ncbi:MAG: hypothetical protein ACFFDK_17505 [Promethearchaeota archaeon]
MKFCPHCDNLLLPRKKKLFCKACNEEFELNLDQKDEYQMIKTITHDETDSTPIIIKEDPKEKKISADDRKAHEDFFTSSEGSEE